MDKVLNQRLLLGVTGGIAAYKVAELARLLQRNNVEVQVAMTEAGTRFVTPATFQALTGKPVITDLWDASFANNMAHIELSRGVRRDPHRARRAPTSWPSSPTASPTTCSSTACLARNCPLLVAPAMNREMWDNPATQRNLATLRADGIAVLGPAAGDQACGEVGMGRMLEPEELLEGVLAFLAPKTARRAQGAGDRGPDLRGDRHRARHHQPVAPARWATRSPRPRVAQGAEVTLVSGPTALPRAGATRTSST